jgi:hypothetical protein
MNVNNIIEQMSNIGLCDEDSQEYFIKDIINTINEEAQLGYNSLVYEIITLTNKSIQNICTEIKKVFPEITLKIDNKRIYIDWS